jgi:hypothetical protein
MVAVAPYTRPDMSLDPNERLEALRREVEAEAKPAPPPASLPGPVPPTAPVQPAPVQSAAVPPTPVAPPPTPEVPVAPKPVAPTPLPRTPAAPPTSTQQAPGDGWDLHELSADTSLTTWLGVGLLAVGGYMVLSWFVPGIDLIGSLLLLGAGVVLLAMHLQRGSGAWALYAGAVLIGMGAGRAIGAILPGSPHGLTAVGVGCAFLAISYLRHSQAGGYGWQGIVGGAALGLGLVQLLLGLLPGSPGVIDLILPALLLIGGGLLVSRTLDRSRRG